MGVFLSITWSKCVKKHYSKNNCVICDILLYQRERSNSYEASIKQLQKDLSLSRIEASKIESSMGDALAAKNAEIEALVGSMDALKKQASAAEAKLASLQVPYL